MVRVSFTVWSWFRNAKAGDTKDARGHHVHSVGLYQVISLTPPPFPPPHTPTPIPPSPSLRVTRYGSRCVGSSVVDSYRGVVRADLRLRRGAAGNDAAVASFAAPSATLRW